MTTIANFFASEVMMDALLPALMIALVASTVSVMVLAHRLSFLTVGVAHASLAGLGLASILGLPLLPVASLVAVLVALLLAWMPTSRGVSNDAASGMLFAGSMALGVLLLAGADRQSVDLFGLLFGSILMVTDHDLLWMYLLVPLTLLVVFLVAKVWWSIAFDATTAAANGLPVRRYRLLLYATTGVTVILCVKLAGVVLTTGLMVLPAATAWFWGRTLLSLWLISVVAGCLAVSLGLLLAYSLDWPAGAAIVVLLCIFFCVSWSCQWLISRAPKPRPQG
ncbi:MAG: iron chelate uptake ABC transporter family permease subunit [Mariprofundales bacterium]|nr:iron chelate uptake ABC transporter family permease subunit [Mariprofundales bacterium]